MYARRPLAGLRLAATVTVASTLLVTLSGCSGEDEEREYAPPQSLCGIPVDAKALAPFLPPRRKLSVKQEVANGNTARCVVLVDTRLPVQTSEQWLSGNHDTAYFVAGQPNSELSHQADGGRFLYSGNEAFGKTRKCVSKKLLGSELFTAFQVFTSDHRDANAMKQLIVSYTNAVEKTDTCKAGKPLT
ncbi:hypothetical protein ACF1GT_28290 [Streptomyces sp. NPDC014636]|uniref:hypothetical protein n=1 Tax=Streptomyces sp. NPDC014636 TaxID=3364876 RepID=UPI0036F773C9